MKRREFLRQTPLEILGAGALPESAFAQHPGFSPADGEPLRDPERLRYGVEGGAVVGINGAFYNNRPLYCPHGPAAVLGGDRPLLRFIEEHQVYGTFSAALLRDGQGTWFQDWRLVRLEYRPGHITWRAQDASLPCVSVAFEAVPLEGAAGFAVRIQVDGAAAGDSLVWAFGGAHPEQNAMWAFDPVLAPQDDAWEGRPSRVLRRGVEPDKCAGNHVELTGTSVRLTPPAGNSTVLIHPGQMGQALVGDASAYAKPETLLASRPGNLRLACGSAPAGGQPIFLSVESVRGAPRASDPRRAFEQGLTKMREVAARVVVQSPDPYLDAAVASANHAVDAVYYPPVFRHGCMAWNVRLPGWRTLFGGTVFGWHDRVVEQAKFYIASQVRESSLTEADPDPAVRLCNESEKSRLWGKGRIIQDASRYDFQSQLFDQLVHAWRWTGDKDLERLLRGPLELHAEWMKDCFDPDDDGLYESYINTWPTDTVWYDGGGSVEESVYAWTAHRALEELARRAGDAEGAGRHARRAAKIRKALFDALWLPDKGHFAAYKEQGGHGRVHEDAWLYSEFLPIDARMTSFEEAIQALHYTEWALENVRPKTGGRRVWFSNWVPSKWSARELYHGDNYHLALAYFRAGLANEGYEILRGNLLDAGFAKVVPGAQALPEGGCDFNDVLSMFCRAVVEGLFGFAPDLPQGVVRLEPAFPPEWPHASIRTPDFSLAFRRDGDVDRYSLEMARPAALEARIPVSARRVRGVSLNGAPAQWTAEPGAGCTLLRLRAPSGARFTIEVVLEGRIGPAAASDIRGKVGDTAVIRPQQGKLVEVRDLHKAIRGGRLVKAGHHVVLARERVGELDRWHVIRLAVTDPEKAKAEALRTPRKAAPGAAWGLINLEPHYNGDIRTIYKQQYLSPRPKTVSVRIGVDGYSPWTFAPWKLPVPEIDLSRLRELQSGQDRLLTPQGVPFRLFSETRNIAFTSLWDNWPRRVKVPVGRKGHVAWMLVCGSTNPMQTRIANAVLRFHYAGGAEETLDLVPPLNFWSLCPLGGRDYLYERDGFCLPPEPPPTVQLGNNCRAMVLSWRLRPGAALESVTLEALSREVVIGLMGLSLQV